MKVYCVFTSESPHRGDSNEYKDYTIFQYEKEKHPKLSQICSHGIFSKGLKNEFERAEVNESSVFEPLKFYCRPQTERSAGHSNKYSSLISQRASIGIRKKSSFCPLPPTPQKCISTYFLTHFLCKVISLANEGYECTIILQII